MTQTLVTLLLGVLILALLPSRIIACTTRNPFVGIGYNLINGNPDGDPDEAGRDPGLKYNNQILTITYDNGNTELIRGIEYCVGDQVSTVAITSCSYDEETYLFSGTASYQEVFASQVSVDSSYDNGLSSYEFSGSNEYQSVEEASESSESVFFDKRAFCHESQSRYKLENAANDDSYGVTTDFYNAFDGLPDVSSPSNDELEEYYNFLTRWGTHIIEENDLGGRRAERYESTLTELYEYAQETSSTSISLSGAYNGFSTSVSLDIDTLSESTSSSSEFGSYYKTITTGSTLRYDSDNEQWYIPDDDTAAAEPTQLYLVSIAIVCEDNGYWSTISDLADDSAITTFLKYRCNNLETAISGYATYLGVSIATDGSNLPITWPDGWYGLLKSSDGCPSDSVGFSFQEGWRKQKHKKNRFYYTSGHHFYEGTYEGKTVKYYFCMKNVEEANSDYRQSWPAGQYCIFKSAKGDCPDDFSEGSLYWKNVKKGDASRDNKPDGSYSKYKTTILYCCREDGSTNEEIYLPTSSPFYLIRKGDSCQSISGMTVTEERMRIKAKKFRSSGVFPYTDSSDGLWYCYYSAESVL